MAVLGIDLSISKCGLAVYDGGLRMVGTVIPKPQGAARVIRRHIILTYVQRAMLTFPDIATVCMETVRLFHHHKISMDAISALVELSTTIEDWATGQFLEVAKVATNTWKKDVLGSGIATKDDAVRFVAQRFERDVEHDAADAVCLAMWPYLRGLRGVK